MIYSAPEILAGHTDVDFAKTDVYSFGVMLLQIFTAIEPYSQPPFDRYDKWKLEGFVLSGKRLPIPPFIPDKIKTLIEDCWNHNPKKRPDVNTVVKYLDDIMPILSNIKPQVSNGSESTTTTTIAPITIIGNLPPITTTTTNSTTTTTATANNGTMNASQSAYQSPSLVVANIAKVTNAQPQPVAVNTGQSTISTSIGDFLPEKTIFVHGPGNNSSGKTELVSGEDASDLGYCGEISREETAAKLMNQSDGTYLVRWSTKTDSFVLSFVKNGTQVQHIAYIKRNPQGEIVVDKQGGGTCTYQNLNEYVASMKKTGVITKPIFVGLPKPEIEDIYALSSN